MDLSGEWRAVIADDEVRRNGVGLDADDADWEPVRVPGHWRSTPAFAESNGPLLYRTRFELDVPPPGRRHWVVLDGVFYQGDLWLDGAYLGDPEGYFFPHAYDITELARLGREHVLAVEVTCSPQRDKQAKRNITGVFQHWDCIDPAWNPGGLWRPVRIETTGQVRIGALRVLSRDVVEGRANVMLRVSLDSDAARTATVTTLVDGTPRARQRQALAKGVNAVAWNVDVDNPKLWWPWSLGDQPLTEVTVVVEVDGQESDRRSVRTGIREVALDEWTLAVNGERLFAKGANVGPSAVALGEVDALDLRRDVELAREAGLDLLRVHAHITRPEFYDAADELGMLIWQDFPLQWGYARSVRRQAVRQVTEAVDLLGHHPSIAVWCGHNEPFTLDLSGGAEIDMPATRLRYMAQQQLPTWNRSILDRWVKRAFEKADETRPVIGASGLLPHFPRLDGTDSHLYFGWYHGEERDLPAFAAAIPKMVRFVSEFGAQAVPDDADFLEPERWPDLDWERIAARFGLQKWVFDERVPPGRYETYEAWVAATQEYQATLLRFHIETLRRLKYRPTGGFCLFSLVDSQPAVSWSVLDHERRPKAGFFSVVEACRPVIVVAERMPDVLQPGDTVALDLHVVSDRREPIERGTVSAHLEWAGGEHRWRFGGRIDADACVRVGMVRFVVPATAGELSLSLTLDAGEVVATNRYVARIA